jgi:hypothetical protein
MEKGLGSLYVQLEGWVVFPDKLRFSCFCVDFLGIWQARVIRWKLHPSQKSDIPTSACCASAGTGDLCISDWRHSISRTNFQGNRFSFNLGCLGLSSSLRLQTNITK